jgi:hypothetical protein
VNGRICVKPHIDEDLDNRKHVYAGIDDVLVSLKLLCSPKVKISSSLVESSRTN